MEAANVPSPDVQRYVTWSTYLLKLIVSNLAMTMFLAVRRPAVVSILNKWGQREAKYTKGPGFLSIFSFKRPLLVPRSLVDNILEVPRQIFPLVQYNRYTKTWRPVDLNLRLVASGNALRSPSQFTIAGWVHGFFCTVKNRGADGRLFCTVAAPALELVSGPPWLQGIVSYWVYINMKRYGSGRVCVS